MAAKDKPMDQDGTPTSDELKLFFRENDFTTAVSGFDFEHASETENQLYLRIKDIFETAWNERIRSISYTRTAM